MFSLSPFKPDVMRAGGGSNGPNRVQTFKQQVTSPLTSLLNSLSDFRELKPAADVSQPTSGVYFSYIFFIFIAFHFKSTTVPLVVTKQLEGQTLR